MVSNEKKWPQFDNIVVENVGNVISNNDMLKIKQTMDFTYAIRVSSISKVYKACTEVKKTKFSWAELWLSLSTLFLGAFISALVSQIEYMHSFLSIIFYSVCPALGGIFFMAYFMARKTSSLTATKLADIVQENIPNPNEMEE